MDRAVRQLEPTLELTRPAAARPAQDPLGQVAGVVLWVPTAEAAADSAPKLVAAMAPAVAWARAPAAWWARVQATTTRKATLLATWKVEGLVSGWLQRVRSRLGHTPPR
jgi:hypothetical protein